MKRCHSALVFDVRPFFPKLNKETKKEHVSFLTVIVERCNLFETVCSVDLEFASLLSLNKHSMVEMELRRQAAICKVVIVIIGTLNVILSVLAFIIVVILFL